MKRCLMVLPALVALAITSSSAVSQEEKEEPHGPFGVYEYVKGMRGDQEIPAENLKGQKVEIEEDELELIGPDGKEMFEISYTIDEQNDGVVKFSMEIVESALPETVGGKAKGLAKHEGDTITLIYDHAEGASHPKDFTPDGESQHLFVLKKIGELEEGDPR